MKSGRPLYYNLFPIILLSVIGSQLFTSHEAKVAKETIEGRLNILPLPVEMIPGEGYCVINNQSVITMGHFANAAFDPLQVFNEVFSLKSGYSLNQHTGIQPSEKGGSSIHIQYSTEVQHAEGYWLDIQKNAILIRASDVNGVFYAMQTLRQIMRLDELEDAFDQPRAWKLPVVSIRDQPQFSYRGMHLDVCRHFMPLSFVKKYIDLLALHKMNRFHWHLTDDQGWRIEIKKYPGLQNISAWRDETLIGHYRETPDRYDGTKHGGYYTQEEAKEIVRYAAQRGVTVIPEIEMPGHALAALAAYSKLGCTAGPYEVMGTWGVFDDVFCSRESTFIFLQQVLDEVVEIFPSTYIHIGGDECPKTRWKTCPHCQERIQQEGLKDEHELQSYFIKRIEKYLNSKGKKIIGWDEILEGGLAPNATVMSWRGMKGGIEAASTGHDVIMTPGSHCYFDYYQADAKTEPVAIGGLIPLEKVYGFNPVPKELTQQQAKHILGAQANLWTEYIATPEHAEYMAYPRAIALAEVLWTPASRRDYDDFVNRLATHFKILDGLNVHYANHLFEPEAVFTPTTEGLKVEWKSAHASDHINYRAEGHDADWIKADSGQVTFFSEPATIEYRSTGSTIRSFSYQPTMAQAAVITCQPMPSSAYPGAFDARTLIDGFKGTNDFNGRDWCAWRGDTIDILMDFSTSITLNKIELGGLMSQSSWIHSPSKVLVGVSDGGGIYTMWGSWDGPEQSSGRFDVTLSKGQTTVKSLKIRVIPISKIPGGLPGAGEAPWTFIDEISIY